MKPRVRAEYQGTPAPGVVYFAVVARGNPELDTTLTWPIAKNIAEDMMFEYPFLTVDIVPAGPFIPAQRRD